MADNDDDDDSLEAGWRVLRPSVFERRAQQTMSMGVAMQRIVNTFWDYDDEVELFSDAKSWNLSGPKVSFRCIFPDEKLNSKELSDVILKEARWAAELAEQAYFTRIGLPAGTLTGIGEEPEEALEDLFNKLREALEKKVETLVEEAVNQQIKATQAKERAEHLGKLVRDMGLYSSSQLNLGSKPNQGAGPNPDDAKPQ